MALVTIFGDTADGYVTSTSTVYATAAAGNSLTVSGGNVGIITDQLSGGNYVLRQFLFGFDTASLLIAAGSSATVGLRFDSTTGAAYSDLQVRSLDWGPTVDTGDWQSPTAFSALTLAGTYAQADVATAITGGSYLEISGAAVVAALNNSSDGRTRFIVASALFASATDPTVSNIVRVFAADSAGTTSDPYIVLDVGPFVRAVGSVGTTVTGNLSLAYPSTISADDRFVALITASDNIASTGPSGWTLKQGTNNGTGLRTEVWEKDAVATGSESGSLTWTRSSGNASEGRILAIAGADSATDFIEAIAASTNSSSSTVTYPALTTATNGALVVAVESIAGSATLGAVSGTDPTLVEESDDQFDPRIPVPLVTGTDNGTGGTSITGIAPATGSASGDLVVLIVTARGTTTTITPATTGSVASWTSRERRSDGTNSVTEVFTGTLTGTGSINNVALGATVKASFALVTVKNADTTTPNNIDGSQANASSTSCVAPTVTPSAANTLLLWYGGTAIKTTLNSIGNSFNIASPNDFGAAAGGNANTRTTVSVAYKLYPTSGSGSGTTTGTFGAAGTNVGGHIAIASVNAASNPVSMAIDDDNKTTAGTISSGRTATASAAGVNTGVLFAVKPAATSNNITVNAGKGSLTATGLAPRAVVDNRVLPGAGALSAAGLAPKTVIGNIVRPAVGVLTAVGFAATVAVSNNQRVTPGVGALSATAFAPTVAVSNNQRVAAGTGTLSATGFAPSVAISNNQRVLPGVGAVAASGFAPSIVLGVRVLPDVGSVTATGYASSAIATANQFVRAGVGALSATGYAPTIAISDHQRVTPDTGSLAAAGFAPTVTATNNQFARAGTGILSATGFAPSLDLAVHPDVGALSATGYAPTVNVIVGAIQAETGQLSATGFAPTVTATANVVVRPSPGELSVAGFAPTVAVSNNQRVFAGTGTATLTGFAPTAHASDNQTVAPSTGSLVATGYAPSVTIAVRVAPATGQLAATGFAPSIAISDNQRVTAGVGALAVQGFAPAIVAPRAVQAATGQLVATGYAPTVFASDQQIVLPGTGTLTVEGFAPAITIVLGTWVVVSALERVDATYRLERVDAALVLSRTEPALALSRSEAVAELARLDDVSPLALVRAPLVLTPDVPTFVLSLVTTDD